MEKEKLSILQAAIKSQIETIEKIFQKIEARRRKKGEVQIESLAYQLHNLYCAFEDLFKIVANFFENRIEERARNHREILWRMKIPIEGIRPALLSETSYGLLDSLRAFRHFFLHAYSYELNPKKVHLVLEEALKLREIYQREIRDFLAKLGMEAEE
jgi:uncharacterized protein YutE (UPF0331/DUF86 family)